MEPEPVWLMQPHLLHDVLWPNHILDPSNRVMEPEPIWLIQLHLLHDVLWPNHIPDPSNVVMQPEPTGLLQPAVLTVEAVLSSAAAASEAVLMFWACSTYMIGICGSHTSGGQRNFRESPTPSSTGSHQSRRACRRPTTWLNYRSRRLLQPGANVAI